MEQLPFRSAVHHFFYFFFVLLQDQHIQHYQLSQSSARWTLFSSLRQSPYMQVQTDSHRLPILLLFTQKMLVIVRVGSVLLALCARRMVNRSAGANNSNYYSMWESGSCQDCMKRLMQLGVPLHGTPLLKLTPYFSFYSLTNTGARFDL